LLLKLWWPLFAGNIADNAGQSTAATLMQKSFEMQLPTCNYQHTAPAVVCMPPGMAHVLQHKWAASATMSCSHLAPLEHDGYKTGGGKRGPAVLQQASSPVVPNHKQCPEHGSLGNPVQGPSPPLQKQTCTIQGLATHQTQLISKEAEP
jgi:hypothetical protein